MIEKIKALLQWLVQLERNEHRHWCFIRYPEECKNAHSAWMCNGIFCSNKDRKDCINCVRSEKQKISEDNRYTKVL
jgi:hypothetical protein